jgi:DNA-binding IclR family transcriptional regulator
MTDRRSPPTERVAQVLTLLAEHTGDPMTLAVISDRLGLSRPTCLGILTTLCDTGFVHRTPEKTYRLGPMLLRIGRAAELGTAPLDLLLPHLHALHQELGLGCLLTAMKDGHIVVIGRAGAVPLGDSRDLVGERFPAVPPLGLAEMLWNGDQALDAWLDQPPLVPVVAPDRVFRRLVGAARRAGHLVEHLSGEPASRNDVLANLVTSGLPEPVVATLQAYLPPADWSDFTAEPPSGPADIATIHAPVHDRRGIQQYSLDVLVHRRRVPADVCATWIGAVVRTARAATAAIGGRNPWDRAGA